MEDLIDPIINELDELSDKEYEEEYNFGSRTLYFNFDKYVQIAYSTYLSMGTDKYYVRWYVKNHDEFEKIFIYDLSSPNNPSKLLLSIDMPFDLRYFAILKYNTNLINKTKVCYTSADIINKQIEKLLNNEPIKHIPQYKGFE